MDSVFNPYREWLQIRDGRRPANHYALLGLPPLEADPAKIVQAAESLRSVVRRIRPGEHVAQWQGLLDEIARAKACLTDPQAKAAYDEQLRRAPGPALASKKGSAGTTPHVLGEERLRPHGAPPWEQEETPVSPAAKGGSNAVAAVSPGRSNRTREPLAPPVAATPVRGVKTALSAPPVVQTPTPAEPEPDATTAAPAKWYRGPAGYALAAGVLLAVGVLAYLMIGRFSGPPAAEPAGVEVAQGANSAAETPTAATPAAAAAPGAADVGAMTPAAPDDAPAKPQAPESAMTSGPAAEPMAMATAPAAAAPSAAAPAAAAPAAAAPAAAAPAAAAPAAAVPAAAVPAAAAPAPAADSFAPEFRQTLLAFRAALRDRKMDEARKLLDQGKAAAHSQAEKDFATASENLYDMVDQFWTLMQTRAGQLQATEEIEVGDTRMIVVENVDKRLTVKAAGQIQKFTVPEMPGKLLASLAGVWLGKDAQTKTIFGAFLIMDREGDPQRGAAMWQEAAQGGVPVADYVPKWELVDPSPAPPPAAVAAAPQMPKPVAQLAEAVKRTTSANTAEVKKTEVISGQLTPLPKVANTKVVVPTDKVNLKLAEDKYQANFAELIKDAATPAKKGDLAKTLLERTGELGEIETLWVVLQHAQEFAIVAARVELALLIDERTADRFRDVEVLDLKAQSLEQMGKGAKTKAVALEVTNKAMDLAQEAQKGSNKEVAKRSAKVAAETARKALNPSLLKQAQALLKEVNE